MTSRVRLAALVLVMLLAAASAALSDNASAKSADPKEHALLLELAQAERAIASADMKQAASKLQKLANEQIPEKVKVKYELDVAHALLNKRDFDGCIKTCDVLVSAYKDTDPEAFGWASYYKATALERQKKYAESAKVCNEISGKLSLLKTPQSYIQSQRKLAQLIWQRKLDPEAAFAGVTDDVWKKSVMLAKHAERGDFADAALVYAELKKSVPANDDRSGLITLRYMASLLDCYERREVLDKEILAKAKALEEELELTSKGESWVLTRARLVLAASMVRSRTDLSSAEVLLRKAVGETKLEDYLPQGMSLLAECLYAQGSYSEAAESAEVVADRFPYSTWSDFALFTCADSLYRSGKKAEALAKLEELKSSYPDSAWTKAAKTMKEVAWK